MAFPQKGLKMKKDERNGNNPDFYESQDFNESQDYNNNYGGYFDSSEYLDGILDDPIKWGYEPDVSDKSEIVADPEKKLADAIRMAQKESLGRLGDIIVGAGDEETWATDVAQCNNGIACGEVSSEKKLEDAIRLARKESLARLGGIVDCASDNTTWATDVMPCNNSVACDEEIKGPKTIINLMNMSEMPVLQERHPVFLKNWFIHPDFFRRIELVPTRMTEARNAALFGDIFQKYLAHCRPLGGFLVFTGKRWEKDEDKARGLVMSFTDEQLAVAGRWYDTHEANIQQRLKAVNTAKLNGTYDSEKNAQDIKAEATAKSIADSYYALAKKANTTTGIDNILKNIKTPLIANPEDFDAHPFLLNTPNGTVNLRTSELLPHNPADRITKMTAVSPNLINMDKWLGFMKDLTGGDKEFELYLQKLAGLCLIGKVKKELLVLAKGSGSNGKSTFFNVIAMVLGDFACMLSPDVLIESRTKNIGPELALLKGRRLALASELPSGKHLDANAMKRLVSTDFIHAEAKYCAPISFKPSHTLILLTNNYPFVRDHDYGTWRRIMAAPFSARFVGKGTIENYADILIEEAGGAALYWMIMGARIDIEQDFSFDPLPKCVEEETKEYRSDNSWISRFTDSRCECKTGVFARAGELFAAYVDFAKQSGEDVKTQTEFSAAMVALGHAKKRRNVGVTYEGVSLRQL
jgi:P4 family phage/plasmid primase-like protien